MGILDRLFGRGEDGKEVIAGGGRVAARVEPVADPAIETDHARFMAKLNTVLSQNADVVSGRVHLIGLDEIRELFGDRWPKVAAMADKVARQAIEHRLTPSDLYTPYGETAYMVVFGGISQIEAQMKCALVAREIAERLLGTQGAEEHLQVSTVVFKEGGRLTLKPMSNFDALIKEFEARWHEQEARQREVSNNWETPEAQEASWANIAKHLNFSYRPVWTVHSHAVAAYALKPTLPSDGGRLFGYGILPPTAPPRFLSRLDLLALRQAARDLVMLQNEGKAVMIAITVHYETLLRVSARIAYVSELQMIAEGLRRKLMLEIVGIAEAVPASRLNEMTSAIAGDCRAILIRLPRGYGHFETIRKTRIFACGLDASEGDGREPLLFADFDRFCEDVEAIGRRKYLVEANTTSLLTAAIGAGFDYIDGDAVALREEQPEAVHALGLEDIFRPHAEPLAGDGQGSDDDISSDPWPRGL